MEDRFRQLASRVDLVGVLPNHRGKLAGGFEHG
jgi:hypothetical protein